jgi:hypothetical protein
MSNINYSDFKRLRQDELKTFADLVYVKMNGVTVYSPFQTAVTNLKPIAEVYQQALLNAIDGGKDRIKAKNEAKDALFAQLTKIGKFMDAEWLNNSEDNLKETAGYTLVKVPERRVITYIDAPSNFTVLNDDRKGVIVVKWDSVENARTYGFEELQEDGTWRNGRYCTKSPMQITDLPLGLKMTLRMKTIGPEELVSAFTEPATVWVS